MKQTEILTHATHVNGWEPAVYMSCMSQNFRLFHVSNLSVRSFRIFLLMYPGSLCLATVRTRLRRSVARCGRCCSPLPLPLPLCHLPSAAGCGLDIEVIWVGCYQKGAVPVIHALRANISYVMICYVMGQIILLVIVSLMSRYSGHVQPYDHQAGYHGWKMVCVTRHICHHSGRAST